MLIGVVVVTLTNHADRCGCCYAYSCAMTTGVEITNGQTHRTYRKSAIAPTLLLQAND